MAVKRYKVSNRLLITGKDAPAGLDLRNVYVVLADDYDALAAELAEAQRMIAVWEGKWRDCEVKFQNTQSYGVTAQAAHLARIRELEAALRDLYDLVRKQGMDNEFRQYIETALASGNTEGKR